MPPLQGYVAKMRGQRYDPSTLKMAPTSPSRFVVLLSSFLGAFIGIAIIALLSFNVQWFVERNVPVITGSFGASAVLIYGAIEAPLSQPRNAVGGHILSALIGVSLYKLFNLLSEETFAKLHWLLCSLAVSISLFAMQITHTVHPPGSASALIAVTGGQAIYDLGYWFVLCPIALGVVLMMVIAVAVNNITRRYPTHWWSPKTRRIAVVDQDMSMAIADFISPKDEVDEDEGEGSTKEGGESVHSGRVAHGDQHTRPSSSSSTDSPSTVGDVPAPAHTRRPSQQHPHHPPPHHPEGHYAVYYGGERHERLHDGEMMLAEYSHSDALNDVEHNARRPSIHVEMRRPSHASHLTTRRASRTEDEHLATIEQLQQRIAHLESQLASTSK
ncbi:HPP family-domain-containing protein [Gamsiella multidivaricata]|uniref:HPP family-domain-containing protein n=1 Tax=Gamsiella multidivaricata TaxID=101098 RepID=UPI00221EEB49|nr:HPP family-domain-containing protein [Gamsiella multidivaricata]KAG0368791.1 hypothetical protein BGZ54_001160 [Gamsiella multidivaricata]KAI7822002.1 HPP family-domain-containing protein [Gamsiella multidivaricata]